MRWPSQETWPEHSWHSLPEEAILAIPIARLNLKLEDTPLFKFVRKLYQELQTRGLEQFQPHIYLSDEWFSPDGVPAIAVPFYLADPRLMALEEKFMLEVEGGSPKAFMQLLRHECGHAFDHAYELSKTRSWQKLFGAPTKTYNPTRRRLEPDSRNFVAHLPDFYSQTHPTEDFAETFATVITPGMNWEKRYRFFPEALRKLEYVAELIERWGQTPPKVRGGVCFAQASRMRRTLRAYYNDRLRLTGKRHPAFFDHDLRTLFPKKSSRRSATSFLGHWQPYFLEKTVRSTGAHPYFAEQSYEKLAARCMTLRLDAPTSPEEALTGFLELLTRAVKVH